MNTSIPGVRPLLGVPVLSVAAPIPVRHVDSEVFDLSSQCRWVDAELCCGVLAASLVTAESVSDVESFD